MVITNFHDGANYGTTIMLLLFTKITIHFYTNLRSTYRQACTVVMEISLMGYNSLKNFNERLHSLSLLKGELVNSPLECIINHPFISIHSLFH